MITNTEFCTGTIERISFYNEENGFAVLKIQMRGHRELMTVVGSLAQPNLGEDIQCQGHWIHDKNYGLQFRATDIKTIPPTTLLGIQKYLGSGLIKGIGPHFAKQLIQAFGVAVFDVIEKNPEQLNTLPGIGAIRKQQIIDGWQQQKIVRDILLFLHTHGLGTARAVRIYKTYGEKAIDKITKNPYRLALDIQGIGFKTADKLAQTLGIPADSILRAQAGIRHILQEQAGNGHCWMLFDELIQLTHELLDMPTDIIQNGIIEEHKEGRIQQEKEEEKIFIALTYLYRAEKGIVEHLERLKKEKLKWSDIAIEKAIPWVEEKTKLQLSISQKEAVQCALQEKVIIITGGPGVGKTTVINSILQILKQKNIQITLCAPTGRAAKRLSEATQLPAKTIHRLLGRRAMALNTHDAPPLTADLFVVDEASMIDVPLFYQFLKALPAKAALFIVGDVDQLPSVGPGCVLSDLIASQKIPTIRLTEIFRQAATSQIIVNAHRINEGKMPWTKNTSHELTDFYWVTSDTPEDIQEKLIHLVSERIPNRFGFHPVRDIQVLSPMNRNNLGVHALNVVLQETLNHQKEPEITRFGMTYRLGDKVIQTVNNYDKDIFNGDIGFIQKINLDLNQVAIAFDQKMVHYDIHELDEIALAYAISIHKSQGSEYPAVVIPIATQHFMLLERHLLYTAVTRGKKLVVLIGQKRALGMAVHKVSAQKRMTRLMERL